MKKVGMKKSNSSEMKKSNSSEMKKSNSSEMKKVAMKKRKVKNKPLYS
jgi:hypothetical protein